MGYFINHKNNCMTKLPKIQVDEDSLLSEMEMLHVYGGNAGWDINISGLGCKKVNCIAGCACGGSGGSGGSGSSGTPKAFSLLWM